MAENYSIKNDPRHLFHVNESNQIKFSIRTKCRYTRKLLVWRPFTDAFILIYYYSDELQRTSILTGKILSCKNIEQLTLNVINGLEYLYQPQCPDNYPRGKLPPVRVRVLFRVSVKIRVWGQFSSMKLS